MKVLVTAATGVQPLVRVEVIDVSAYQSLLEGVAT